MNPIQEEQKNWNLLRFSVNKAISYIFFKKTKTKINLNVKSSVTELLVHLLKINMTNRNDLYKKAYTLLNNYEIFKFDCGNLCGKLCCKDGFYADCESGMRLLPGEEEFIGKNNYFRYKKNQNGAFLICNGSCNRDLRPFACRIFPYYPHISVNKNGKFKTTILPDPVAASVCPLVFKHTRVRRNIFHDRALKRAIRILCKDEEIKKELLRISDFNNEILLLRQKLFSVKN